MQGVLSQGRCKGRCPLLLAIKLTVRTPPACSEHHQSVLEHLETKPVLRVESRGCQNKGGRQYQASGVLWEKSDFTLRSSCGVPCSLGALCCGISSHPLRFQRIIVALILLFLAYSIVKVFHLSCQTESSVKMLILHLYLLVSITFVCSWVCLQCI